MGIFGEAAMQNDCGVGGTGVMEKVNVGQAIISLGISDVFAEIGMVTGTISHLCWCLYLTCRLFFGFVNMVAGAGFEPATFWL